MDADFPEISEALYAGEWTTVAARSWAKKGTSMPELELASLVWSVRRMTRNSGLFGHRVLFLSDSMSAILALSKGRSSSALLTGCRVWAAHVLAFSLMPCLRWIPSEFCAADKASRLHVPQPGGHVMGVTSRKFMFNPHEAVETSKAEATPDAGEHSFISDEEWHDCIDIASPAQHFALSPARARRVGSDGLGTAGRPNRRQRKQVKASVGPCGIGSHMRDIFTGSRASEAERPAHASGQL